MVVFKSLLLALCGYVFYWRVWEYYRACRFYGAQGEKVCFISPYTFPVVGSSYLVLWSAWKSWSDGDNYFLLKHFFDLLVNQNCKTGVGFISTEPGLGIGDVKVVEAMYTTKNKYFDKHPIIGDLAFSLTGDSILFANTNPDWRQSRKAMSPAFYKGKLESMVEIGKQAVVTTVKRFEQIAEKGNPKAEIDIMEEIGMMTARILLVCALGVDCAEEPVDFW